jgi:hypothetical protein
MYDGGHMPISSRQRNVKKAKAKVTPKAKPGAKPNKPAAKQKREPGFMWKALKQKQEQSRQSGPPGSKFFKPATDKREQAPQDVTYWNKFAGPRRRAG